MTTRGQRHENAFAVASLGKLLHPEAISESGRRTLMKCNDKTRPPTRKGGNAKVPYEGTESAPPDAAARSERKEIARRRSCG